MVNSWLSWYNFSTIVVSLWRALKQINGTMIIMIQIAGYPLVHAERIAREVNLLSSFPSLAPLVLPIQSFQSHDFVKIIEFVKAKGRYWCYFVFVFLHNHGDSGFFSVCHEQKPPFSGKSSKIDKNCHKNWGFFHQNTVLLLWYSADSIVARVELLRSCPSNAPEYPLALVLTTIVQWILGMPDEVCHFASFNADNCTKILQCAVAKRVTMLLWWCIWLHTWGDTRFWWGDSPPFLGDTRFWWGDSWFWWGVTRF